MVSYVHSLSQSLTRLADAKVLEWHHVPVPLTDGSQACIQYLGPVDAKSVLLLVPSITGTAEQFWRFAHLLDPVENTTDFIGKEVGETAAVEGDVAPTSGSYGSELSAVLDGLHGRVKKAVTSKLWSYWESTKTADTKLSSDPKWHFNKENTALVVLNKRGHHCALKTPRWDPFGDVEETAALVEVAKSLFPECKQAYAIGFSGGGLALGRYLEMYASPHGGSKRPPDVESEEDPGWMSYVRKYLLQTPSFGDLGVTIQEGLKEMSQPSNKQNTAKWIKKAAIVCSPLHSGMMEAVPSWLYWHLRGKIIQKYFLLNLEVWKKPGECVLAKLATRGVNELADWASPEGKKWNRGVSLAAINTPILVIQAKDDIFWGWNEAWREACTPGQGKFVLYEEGGHLGFYDSAGASHLERKVLTWFADE